MAVPDLNDIIDMADHLLETIVKSYDEAYQEDNTLTIPDRRYYTVGGQGSTVHDCEQITVTWDQGYSGTPGDDASNPTRCDEPFTLGFVVEVVRKVDSLPPSEEALASGGTISQPSRYAKTAATWSAPDPEGIMSDARVQMKDAAILSKAGTLAGEHTTLGRAIVDVSAGTPSGQYQAVIMNFAAAAGLDPTTF